MGLRDRPLTPEEQTEMDFQSWKYCNPDNYTIPTKLEVNNFFLNGDYDDCMKAKLIIFVTTFVGFSVISVLFFYIMEDLWKMFLASSIPKLWKMFLEWIKTRSHKPQSPATPFEHYKKENWQALNENPASSPERGKIVLKCGEYVDNEDPAYS
jgi:hypothetical protein